MGQPEDLGTLEISFDLRGSHISRTGIKGCDPFAQFERFAPNHLGAFVEVVDDDPLGVPIPWLGAIPTAQLGGDVPNRVLDATGPALYLDEVPTGPVRETNRPAADIVRNANQSARKNTWIQNFTASTKARGRAAGYETGATTFWKLATDLATARNEAFFLTPHGGAVATDLHWMTPDGGRDLSGDITLIDGVNCIPQPTAYGLRPKLSEALLIGQSFGLGSDTMATEIKAPAGARPLGLHDALNMTLSTRPIRKLTGAASEALPDLEQTSQEGLDLVADTMFRRSSIPKLLQQIEVTDCSLWPHLMPNNLVGAKIQDDAGVFHDAIVRIRTAQFRLLPDRSCMLSVDLYRKAQS